LKGKLREINRIGKGFKKGGQDKEEGLVHVLGFINYKSTKISPKEKRRKNNE